MSPSHGQLLIFAASQPPKMALKALFFLLKQPLEPEIQMQTHLLLAQTLGLYTTHLSLAEQHLQKAILIHQSLGNSLETLYHIKHLQLRLYLVSNSTNAAKTLLKNCLYETENLHLHYWYYVFSLEKIQHCYNHYRLSTALSALETVSQYAKKRQDDAIHNYFMLIRMQLTMDKVQSETTFQTANQCHPVIWAHYACLKILKLCKNGRFADAMTELKELHVLLEQSKELSQNEEFNAGLIKLVISEAPSVTFKVLSRNQLFAFVYYMSAMVFKSSSTGKALKFVEEGLKCIEMGMTANRNDLTLEHGVGLIQWFQKMRLWLLYEKIMALLLSTDVLGATEVLQRLEKDSKSIGHDVWRLFEPYLTLCQGYIHVYLEEWNLAEKCFEALLDQSGTLQVISYMQLYFIYSNKGQLYDMKKASEMLRLLTEFPAQDKLHVKNLIIYVEAINAKQQQIIQKSKELFLSCLNGSTELASSQLKSIALGMLGDIFLHTEPNQAEKMLLSGLNISRKQHYDGISIQILDSLCHVYENQGLVNKKDECARQKVELMKEWADSQSKMGNKCVDAAAIAA